MNQLLQLWKRLTWTQRTWLAVAVVAVIGGLTGLNRWNQERDFKPLFSGLAPEDAGTVTAKLRELGVEYRLADEGSTILAHSDKIAETRLQLASAGLPKSGHIGFELFDKANLGASEFAEQVNYHRAIEGELERSIMSVREVEQARVHITMAKDSLYSEQRQPAKASIVVKLRHAGSLTPQNVAAVCQLTASAVPGLSPEQVSLVDTSGNLLNRPRPGGEGNDEQDTEAALEYRKGVEHDVQTKIAQTLQPLLGADHFRAGVSADVDLTSADQSDEVFDPQKSVIATSQTTQDGPGLPSASGIPGTPSNLPNPTSQPVLNSSGASNYARHTESVTYQTSRSVKHTKLPQGTLKRLSLAVLVDHTLRWEGTKRIIEPPSAEKLKVIRDLVAAATGLDIKRGDQLVVDAFPFESTLTAEPLVAAAPAASTTGMPAWLQELMAHKNIALIAGLGVAGMMTLIIGWVVMVMRRKKKMQAVELAKSLEEAKTRELTGATATPESSLEAEMAKRVAETAKQDAEALLKLKLPVIATKKTDVLTKHIATEIKKDPLVMAQVVRSWLHGDSVKR